MSRKDEWIQTASGDQFWPLDPRPEDTHIFDIASALSKLCRFGGHSNTFYSVAHHCCEGSVYIEKTVGDLDAAFAFLLHDASEAYICDIPRPLKRLPEFAGYLEIEDNINKVIAQKFGIDFSNQLIWEVDDLMLATERKCFMPSNLDWGLKALDYNLKAWSCATAFSKYSTRFIMLSEKLSRTNRCYSAKQTIRYRSTDQSDGNS